MTAENFLSLENGECDEFTINNLNSCGYELREILPKIKIGGVIKINLIDCYQFIVDIFKGSKNLDDLNELVKNNNVMLSSKDVRSTLISNGFKILIEDRNGCESYIEARRK